MTVRYWISSLRGNGAKPAGRLTRAEAVRRFHESVPGYEKSPLVGLPGLAEQLGLKGIYVKDESERFGLQAFKGLGGSYAMFRILCDRFGLDPEAASLEDFRQPERQEALSRIHFVTCTDGNHGRGVAWAAGLFGCRAHVYMPYGTQPVRAENIRRAGPAEVSITDLSYDDTVAYAGEQAAKEGWILIQDTAWEGYEEIPGWIVEGYLTLAAEAAEELEALSLQPTHLFLQAGVGAMAGSVLSYMADYYGEKKPVTLIVEPVVADCHFRSAQAGDGQARSVEGAPVTIMAGLNCGTPCSLTWPVIRDYAEGYLSCDDPVAAAGMRAYAAGLEGDPKIISGESGAAPLGALLALMQEEALDEVRKAFKLGPEAVVLLINTEGATDPENYRKIVGRN
ncbi:MAG: diaminopropionate ammonia-lyase [Lachnospiraceae bacterium]|nr:diaminopropionate ammonia-lyase [Lachnospiraceae bacterium]